MGKVIDYHKALALAEGEARLFITFVNGMARLRKSHSFSEQDIEYYQRLTKRLNLLKQWEAFDLQHSERKIA
ncbi:hypothetical protein H1S01_15510 [Heliobacterium chlorum]|uniref:Uncharacterized protein n=1 Tax=Heliobacterium chlorum TaxID=2698 RepID=A0ABR7T6N4_HELCL|nr:hypothetical protein [Heliobacterium chlorum]MBC9785892.1 hypothetical protein [Heliobacterium chlorum]